MSLESVLEGISRELKSSAELIAEDGQSDKILDFCAEAERIRRELEQVEEAGRLMRLGIVGEVKAGKSSFLNALFFDGKSVLPKAATPMTAALTCIRYSEQPSAKVVFYTEDDWKQVELYATSYEEKLNRRYQEYVAQYEEARRREQRQLGSRFGMGTLQTQPKAPLPQKTREEYEAGVRAQMSEEERNCKEIYDMAKKIPARDLDALIGQERVLEGFNAEQPMMHQLREYVGAGGRYTPIVKYTELSLNRPELEGVEIIDTPGMNDPIHSRSRTTKKFLTQCDALFLLGYAGQFLGAEEISFINRVIPEEAIARYVLIGTKMDSAVRQYERKDASYRDAYLRTRENCYAQAKENLAHQDSEKLAKHLPDGRNPILVSAMADSAARKLERGERLDADERNMIDGLSRFRGFQANPTELHRLSQMHVIRKKVYPEIRADKDRIIEEKKRNARNSQRGKFLRLLEEISNETRQIEKDLRTGDVDQLREKLEAARDALDGARVAVTNIFDSASVRVAKRIIPQLQIEVRAEVSNHLHVEVKSSTKTVPHKETSGILFWKETHTWDEHITTHTADVSDVEHNLRMFYTEILRLINDAMQEAVQLDRVKDQVIDAVLKAFDTSDRSFDENAILIPINNALERITIARVELDLEQYLNQLDHELTGMSGKADSGVSFSWSAPVFYENGVVKNEGIPRLKQAQGRVLSRMTEDACSAIGTEGERISRELEERAGIFIDQITEKLESNHRKVESMIADKEENLARLDQFIHTLNEAKKKIREADQ